jgi:hypothetical protein
MLRDGGAGLVNAERDDRLVGSARKGREFKLLKTKAPQVLDLRGLIRESG